MITKIRLSSLTALLVLILSIESRGDIISSFDVSDEGWNIVSLNDPQFDNYAIVGTYSATHNLAGGNPGGYISIVDPDSGAYTFSAPGTFLGDVSTATGLSYDIVYSTHPIDYQPTDVILEGNGMRLLWKSIPDLSPSTSWSSVALSFSPSASWRVNTSGGALATAADFQNVLSNLSALYIRGEYTNGLVETSGIDNVRLQGVAIPEPNLSICGLVALVIACVGTRHQRAVVVQGT